MSEYIIQLEDRSFMCTICEKTAPHKGNLKKHMESMHFQSDYKESCEYCGKLFKNKNSLQNHISLTHKDRTQKRLM